MAAEKRKVLIIDDLDRMDPDHIFRIMNVFAAQFDHERFGYNKFAFDKVIIVCDLDNLRNLFAHKYGSNVDFSGYIDKVTDYEAIPPSLLIERKGALVQDDFNGEQAIVFNVKERGLVVLSGCAHVGIVNTIRHAQKITGIKKLHMIIGGFHLINAKTEIIMKTVADIKAMEPDYIVPTHCTGFEAIATFYREMPKQFILNTVGTKYVITAKKTQI